MKWFGPEPLIRSAFSRALDPAQFMPLDEFCRRIDRLVEMVKKSELARGVDEVFIAGEIEFRRRADRLRDGIPLSQVVFKELETLAEESAGWIAPACAAARAFAPLTDPLRPRPSAA